MAKKNKENDIVIGVEEKSSWKEVLKKAEEGFKVIGEKAKKLAQELEKVYIEIGKKVAKNEELKKNLEIAELIKKVESIEKEIKQKQRKIKEISKKK